MTHTRLTSPHLLRSLCLTLGSATSGAAEAVGDRTGLLRLPKIGSLNVTGIKASVLFKAWRLQV
jgi:hypothetical protein